MPATVRRIRADEWSLVRTLRLDALRDPAAPLAFLESYDDAATLPDEFWQARAAGSADGDHAAQLVAIDDDRWVGSTTALVQRSGTQDHHGRLIARSRPVLVGVYVRPSHRGTGVVGDLIEAAADWCRERGFTELVLNVHRDNHRAVAAYRRAGFVPSGLEFTGVIGPEIEMVRPL
ncbi:GNAT family N-acetyltransferase [Cellulomonas sp. URHD0024]|uniref:GNAT family N-acetyltransferase n=1 Tax=Cellulomonas sp. URHD0024 TaxID=1302620 RepID=UPI000418A05F|nr:GNAT family N-acetyltransferase [Cellulomonas sp. URHD0024]